MKNSKNFPFEQARRVSEEEVRKGRKAIERLTGKKRPSRGRPPKDDGEKFVPVAIRLHPLALQWAKDEARRQGCGYQTVINDVLLAKSGLGYGGSASTSRVAAPVRGYKPRKRRAGKA